MNNKTEANREIRFRYTFRIRCKKVCVHSGEAGYDLLRIEEIRAATLLESLDIVRPARLYLSCRSTRNNHLPDITNTREKIEEIILTKESLPQTKATVS